MNAEGLNEVGPEPAPLGPEPAPPRYIYAHGDECCYCCGRGRHTASGTERPLILTDKGWACATVVNFCRVGTTPVTVDSVVIRPMRHVPLLGTGATLTGDSAWVYAHQRQAIVEAGRALTDSLGVRSHARALVAAEAAVAAYLRHMIDAENAR